MNDEVYAKYAAVTAGQPETIRVGTEGGGMWRVPRVFIACHGLKAAELRELAETFGWEHVR